jgi:glutaminyl-tRNA synthetase
LIRAGKAYVDDQSQEEMRATRGTLTEPGKNSPFRDRGIEENLDLFRRMRAGEFGNGARVLRAKIDMASGNINLRDPVLYRILHAEHPRTGKTWSIYPSYDFAHGQSDAIEGITHSLCTLEFEDHRPLYDWFLQNLPVPSQPHQYEFARLRACRRSPACGGAVCRLRRSAISSSASASPRPTASSTWRCWNFPSASI